MRLIIKSRKAGKTFQFWAPDGGGYIRIEDEGKPGTLGKQLCYAGGFTGVRLEAKDVQQFEVMCRKWYKHHMAKNY